MKEKVTVGTPFLNPHWLNGFRTTRVIKENNQVIIDDVPLIFSDDTALPDGIEVEVIWGGRDFYAESVAEKEANLAEWKRLRDEVAAKLELEMERHRQVVDSFNRSLNIPVAWTPGIKDVLSGLSEGSNGDGQNARTVFHVLLEEPLQEGRLTRNKGDFLCTSKSGSNGKAWSSQRRDNQKVSCKACLSLAKRWRD